MSPAAPLSPDASAATHPPAPVASPADALARGLADAPREASAPPRSRRRLRSFWGLTTDTIARAFDHGATGHASQFAYNAFIATVPFLFVLVAAVSKLAGHTAYERASAEFDHVVPEELRGTLLRSLNIAERNAAGATLTLVIGVPVAIYVTCNAVGSLVNAIDNANGLPHRTWLRGKLVAIVLAMVTAVLVLATTSALIGGPALVHDVVELFSSERAGQIGRWATYPISLAALAAFTLILYRVGPSHRSLGWRDLLPGTVGAVACWLGATRLFGLYTSRFNTYDNVYGSFGLVVVYLIYLYLSGLVLIMGAEVNAAWAARRAAAAAERGDA